MLKFKCRQRIRFGAKFELVSETIQSPIRALDWEFLVETDDENYIKLVEVNKLAITSTDVLYNQKRCVFVLPASVAGLTRVDIETYGTDRETFILDVIRGYQLPDTVLYNFHSVIDLYKRINLGNIYQGEFNTLNLVDGTETHSSEENDTDIRKIDIPKQVRKEISSLFANLLHRPNVRLIDEKTLVEPGELQRVTPATIDYFIRHPDTWHKRGYLHPRPTKLLDDRTVEDYDIYENRFALHFLETMDVRLNSLVEENKHVLTESELKLHETLIDIRQGLSGIPNELIDTVQQQLDQMRQNLAELKRFHNEIQRLRSDPIFSTVHRLPSKPHLNTVLRLHPIYGKLYQYYELIGQEKFNHQRLKILEEVNNSNILTAYQALCFAVIYQAIKEALLENNLFIQLPQTTESSEMNCNDKLAKNELFIKDNPTLRYAYSLSGRSVTVTLCLLRVCNIDSSLVGSTLIEVKNENQDGETLVDQVFLIPDVIWWGSETIPTDEKQKRIDETYQRVLEIYDGIEKSQKKGSNTKSKRKKNETNPIRLMHSVILLHPTSPDLFDERMPYRGLRLLINQGDNFQEANSYKLFGNYKIGCLPIYPSKGEVHKRVISRIARLLRIHLSRVGVNDICWVCRKKARTNIKSENITGYICDKCQLEWGEVVCNKCSSHYVKMRPRNKVMEKITPRIASDLTDKTSIVLSEALEAKLAISSPCESLDHIGSFWAICPGCGECQKEGSSKSCKRCQSLQEKRK